MSKSGKGARRGGAAAAAPKLFDESLRNVQVGEQTLKTSILPDLVLLHALESPKKVFLEMWNPESNALTSITFGEFAQRVGAARARLEASGIAPGKRVGFLCQASVEYFVLVLAAMSAGATVVNLIWRQPVDNLMEMCRAVVLDDLIASPAYESESKQLQSASAFSGRLLFLAPVAGEAHIASDRGSFTLERLSSAFVHPSVAPTDVAVIMFTSGSTSVPKAVPLTHRGLCWLFESKGLAEGYADVRDHGGALCLMPCFHVMGFCNNFLFNLYTGVRAFLLENADAHPVAPQLLIDAVKVCRPTVLTTVPWIMEAFATMAESDPEVARTLSSVAYILVGGAKLSKFCVSTLSARNVRVRSICGATEVGGSILIGEAGEPTLRMRPYPGVGWELQECSGYEADDGANQGVLILSNAFSVTPGYIRQNGQVTPEELNSKFSYNTHDVFREVSEGWTCHVCRADDLIVHSSGEKSNPVPIELVLKKELGTKVERICIVGVDQPRPVLIAQLSAAAAAKPSETAAAILHAVEEANSQSPAYSRLDWRQVLVVLPKVHAVLPVSGKGNVVRNAVGKKFAPELVRIFEAGRDEAEGAPGAWVANGLIQQLWNGAAAAVGGRRQVRAASLKEPLMDAMESGSGAPPCEHGWLAANLAPEQLPQGEKEWDSLDFASMVGGQRSVPDAMRGHLYFMLMFCVVVRHVVHKYQQHAMVLSNAHLYPERLQGVHNAFGTFAIPGFIALVGFRDSEKPPKTLADLKRLVLTPLIICAAMEFVLPPLLRLLYGDLLGFAPTTVKNQSLLPYFASWLLLMITICRFLLFATSHLGIPRAGTAILSVAMHFGCAYYDCPWPLTRYGRHFNTVGPVRPVLSAYYHFYALLPLVMPSTFLKEIPDRSYAKLVYGLSLFWVLAVSYWSLNHFNTEFSAGADRRRYGCSYDDYMHAKPSGMRKFGMNVGRYLVDDVCARWDWADLWQDGWHNALSFSVIAALGHLMPQKASTLSAIGECSLVCLVVHMCLWAFLWPMVWSVVEASQAITTFAVPLLVMFGCCLMVQIGCSFHVAIMPVCTLPNGLAIKLPVIRAPQPFLFNLAWYGILLLKLGVLSGVIPSGSQRDICDDELGAHSMHRSQAAFTMLAPAEELFTAPQSIMPEVGPLASMLGLETAAWWSDNVA